MFNKKCTFCKTEIKGSIIKRTVPVYGYTNPQKRYFCSEDHADKFEAFMKKALKGHKPGVRLCYKC